VNTTITYEQPLNERIRTLMRLESLYSQIQSNLSGELPTDSRNAVNTLLEIQHIFSRTDIKTDILKELERLSTAFELLSKNPNVDSTKLSSILEELNLFIGVLHDHHGPIGQQLKQNTLLNSIRQRSSIAGGSCAFDLPGFHFWLSKINKERLSDLADWLSHFEVMLKATELMLRMMRESASITTECATGGFFQKDLDTSSPCQLVRVTVPNDCSYYAEISGSKHRFSIRFMQLRLTEKDIVSDNDIEFKLTCCVL